MSKIPPFLFLSVIVFFLLIYVAPFSLYLEFKLAPYKGDVYAFSLENGESIYGRIESVGLTWIKLSDVYYFQSIEVGGEKTQNLVPARANVLTNPPNYMILNTSKIISLEKFGPDSKLLELMKSE